MSKGNNLPSVPPTMSGASGTQLIAGKDVCAALRSACPMLEDMFCVVDGNVTTLMAVNSCGDQKEVCVLTDFAGLDEPAVCALIEQKTSEFLLEEAICTLIDDKIAPFLDEATICQLIADKALAEADLCTAIAENCPHVKDVTVTGTNLIVTYTNNVKPADVFPLPTSTSVDNGDGTTTTTNPDGTTHTSCNDPVKSVTGPGVDNTDPQNPIITGTSTTVPEPEGFHTITTNDGVSTAVCLTPVKSINGVVGDINGNVNVADLFSNTVDNGDGTFTTTNSDSTTVTWSGDTFASQMDNGDGTVTFTMSDSSTVTLCLNPVKSIVQNADGLGATVAYADGTTGALTYPATTTVTPDNGDGTGTVTDGDGNAVVVCLVPVKGVTGDGVDNADPQNPVVTPTVVTDNGDESYTATNADGSSVSWDAPLNLLDKVGAPLASGVKVQTYDDLPNPDRGPIVDLQCVDGAMEATYCDGSKLCFGESPRIIDVKINDGVTASILPGDPDGGVTLGTITRNVTVKKVGGKLALTSIHSIVLEAEFPDVVETDGQGVDAQTWWSLDGGVTKNYFLGGGFDTAIIKPGDGSSIEKVGEFEYFGFAITPDLAPGSTAAFTFGVDLIQNGLITGTADVNRVEFSIESTETVCLEIPA